MYACLHLRSARQLVHPIANSPNMAATFPRGHSDLKQPDVKNVPCMSTLRIVGTTVKGKPLNIIGPGLSLNEGVRIALRYI